MQLLVIQFTITTFCKGWMQDFAKVVEISMFKIFKTLNCPIYNKMGWKSFCCYNSHEVRLCDGSTYSLYVDAAVVLAPWGWHNSVETCRSVIICQLIVRLSVIVYKITFRVSRETPLIFCDRSSTCFGRAGILSGDFPQQNETYRAGPQHTHQYTAMGIEQPNVSCGLIKEMSVFSYF
jgi:hypothetical protein